MKKKKQVVIVGRPNVGKSCLFNRFIGRRKAIVESTSGVTRDRVHANVTWNKKSFELIDTGGLVFKSKELISTNIVKQADKAIQNSSIILFVVDALDGIQAYDNEILDFIRKYNKRIILVVNKVDNMRCVESHMEFYTLGIEDTCFVSALHGLNIDELLELIIKDIELIELDSKEPEKDCIKIALIGRPNVGKSSFLNKLLKEERVIVSNLPGTTRDSIDTYLEINENRYMLIDTAGIRRKKKSQETLDVFSRSRTIEAIKRCDVCIVLLDAIEGIRRDDMHIFNLVKDYEKCCILAINKCDLADLTLKDCTKFIAKKAAFMSFAYTVLCSAKTGMNLNFSLQLAQNAYSNASKKIKGNKLAKTLENIVQEMQKQSSYMALKFSLLTQLKIMPPVFAFVVNRPELIKSSLTRFLENRIRREYDFNGAPLKIIFRKKKRQKK